MRSNEASIDIDEIRKVVLFFLPPPGNPFREFKAGSCDARAGFAFPVGMDACASIPRYTLAT